MQDENKKLFEDLSVEEASDMLKGMLIKIIKELKIPVKQFTEMHREAMIRSEGPLVSARKIASDRNNIIRTTFNKGTMTYKMFTRIVRDILRFNVSNISMTLRDKDNVPWLISMDRMTF